MIKERGPSAGKGEGGLGMKGSKDKKKGPNACRED
jgi:hypothetical protein